MGSGIVIRTNKIKRGQNKNFLEPTSCCNLQENSQQSPYPGKGLECSQKSDVFFFLFPLRKVGITNEDTLGKGSVCGPLMFSPLPEGPGKKQS